METRLQIEREFSPKRGVQVTKVAGSNLTFTPGVVNPATFAQAVDFRIELGRQTAVGAWGSEPGTAIYESRTIPAGHNGPISQGFTITLPLTMDYKVYDVECRMISQKDGSDIDEVRFLGEVEVVSPAMSIIGMGYK